MPNTQNSDRLRLILNKPMERHNLWVSLRKTISKYEEHFKSSPSIFNKINEKYSDWFDENNFDYKYRGIGTDLTKMSQRELKYRVETKSKTDLGKKLQIQQTRLFSKNYKKYYYKTPNKNDFHLIKYLNNWGFFTERFNDGGLCSICGNNTDRNHVTNWCTEFNSIREKTRKKVTEITGQQVVRNLEKSLLAMYHQPRTLECGKAMKAQECIKTFAYEIKKQYKLYYNKHLKKNEEFNKKKKEIERERRINMKEERNKEKKKEKDKAK